MEQLPCRPWSDNCCVLTTDVRTVQNIGRQFTRYKRIKREQKERGGAETRRTEGKEWIQIESSTTLVDTHKREAGGKDSGIVRNGWQLQEVWTQTAASIQRSGILENYQVLKFTQSYKDELSVQREVGELMSVILILLTPCNLSCSVDW